MPAAARSATLDQRALDPAVLEEMRARACSSAEQYAAEEGCKVSCEHLWEIEPIPFDSELIEIADEVVGIEVHLPTQAFDHLFGRRDGRDTAGVGGEQAAAHQQARIRHVEGSGRARLAAGTEGQPDALRRGAAVARQRGDVLRMRATSSRDSPSAITGDGNPGSGEYSPQLRYNGRDRWPWLR
jgi:hypothetical protein